MEEKQSLIELFINSKKNIEKLIRKYHNENNIITNEEALKNYLNEKVSEEVNKNIILFSKEILDDMNKIIDIPTLDLNVWTFEINKSKNMAGCCDHTRKIIKLSLNSYKVQYSLATDSLVGLMNTLAHELLHAVNPGEHHGGNWKKQAKLLNNNKFFNEKYGEITRCYEINKN